MLIEESFKLKTNHLLKSLSSKINKLW